MAEDRIETTRGGQAAGHRPPVLLYVSAVAAVVLAVVTHVQQSFVLLVFTAFIWFVVAGGWLVGSAVALWRTRGRLAGRTLARWLLVPVVMASVFAVTRTSLLLDARFDLSRSALDHMAADVIADGPVDRGWVGLYDVGTVARSGNGVWFVIDNGLGRWGLAYAGSGEPASPDDGAGSWSGAVFEHLDGGWWVWWQTWD